MVLQDAIGKLGDKGDEVYAKICKVTEIDDTENNCTVAPLDGTAELFEVPFNTSENASGLQFKPKLDSIVLVVFLDKHNCQICNVSEIDIMQLLIGTVTFKVDKNGFVIKKGSNSMQSLIKELLDAILVMKFTTNMGPTINLVNATTFTNLKTKFNALLKHS